MTREEEFYHKVVSEIPGAIPGKMFGAQCIKADNGKAAAMFYNNLIVVKLTGEEEREALSLDGASLFNPMGGTPMGGWVQLPYDYKDKWKEFAQKAFNYVKELKPNEKKKK
jgi:hypothetical protein